MKISSKITGWLTSALCIVVVAGQVQAAPMFRPSNVVTVWGDRGGEVIKYALKVKKLKKRNSEVKFAGRCDSACTLYLSMPRSKTCLKKNASFGFHLPYGSSTRNNAVAARYMLKKYPGWVRSWIRANGGLTNRVKRMDYSYASKFVSPCNSSKSKTYASKRTGKYFGSYASKFNGRFAFRALYGG